jgi:hypothetical protein
LTNIVASGVTGRGPSSLCRDALWAGAADLALEGKKIAIVSGFFIPSASSPETDGPTGSIFLARALLRLGRDVRVWTDGLCLDCFRACALAAGFPEENVLDASEDGFAGADEDLLIYVERLGRARDGMYYNMRGENVSEWAAPLDSHALDPRVRTIGIGDGGNEVGMGSIARGLRSVMPDFTRYISVVRTDVCIPADISNWGAYALCAALSAASGEWLGQSPEEERLAIMTLNDTGAVDGVTKKRDASVDGLPLERHLDVISLLKSATGL